MFSHNRTVKYVILTVLITCFVLPGIASGQSDSLDASISITTETPLTNEDITISAEDTTIPENHTVAYEWDTNNDGVYDDKQGETITTEYTTTGEQTVSVKVTATNSTDKNTDTATRTVVVEQRTPDAEFEYSPQDPLPNNPVMFTSSDSNSNGGEITERKWRVTRPSGDSNIGIGKQISYAFPSQGEYVISLQVTLKNGASTTANKTITVKNNPPNAVISHTPNSPSPEDTIEFSAVDSSDPNGDIAEYKWVIDGETRYGETVTTTLSPSGEYDVDLIVTDSFGATSSVSKSVTVQWNDDVNDDDTDSSSDKPGKDTNGDEDTSGAGDTVITPRFELERSVPSDNITTIKRGESVSFITGIDSYRVPDAEARLVVDGKVVATDDVQSETVRQSYTFSSKGSHDVRVVVDDDNGQKKIMSWTVIVHSLNAVPVFAEQSSVSSITVGDDDNFVTFSVENPSVNSKSIVAGISAQPPPGVSITQTKDSSGSAAIQSTSGVIDPGEVKSMRMVVTVNDESMDGDEITFPYQTRYYTVGDSDQVYLNDRRTSTISITDGTTSDTEREESSSSSGLPMKLIIPTLGLILLIVLIRN